MPRPIRAAISASAMSHNLRVAREHAAQSKVWAVIKANAYGHGLLRAAQAFEAADGYAVLDFLEALKLRNAGVVKPILMLEGFFELDDVPLLARHQLTPVIHSMEQVETLRTTSLESPIDVYLKINSGMNRLGFTMDNVRVAWNALKEHAQVRSVTLMTHLADAEGSGVAAQLDWFGKITQPFEGPRSLANSAALVRFPETRADWVRPGLILYGCSPFAGQSAAALGLKPAMSLTSEIIAAQNLTPGERVGYGFTYEASAEMTIGIVACGYADGYPRHAPSGTPVLVAGQRAKTVGRVSMDMMCVDISDIPEAYIGTPVTLWGEGLSADDVAAAAGTVSYQLLVGLAARVPILDVP
ncbi:MAG: alanine racemase [Burkholderiales bacterium]